MSFSKGLTIATAAIIVCFGATVSSAADLSVNGGFETGDFTGWVLFETQPGNTTIITPGASGTYAACINNTATTSGSVIKNANLGIGLVTPGASITISFDARGAGAAGGVGFAEFFSEIDGGGVSSSVLLGGAPLALNADPNVWTSFSFTTTAGPDVSGGVTLQIAAVTGADPASTSLLCVDNVVVDVEGVVSTEQTSLGRIKNSYR